MEGLADKYRGEIIVREVYHNDDGPTFLSTISLEVPRVMVREYCDLKGSLKYAPNGRDFWVETGLAKKLRDWKVVAKSVDMGITLLDALEFLDVDDVVGYWEGRTDGEKLRLVVQEIR